MGDVIRLRRKDAPGRGETRQRAKRLLSLAGAFCCPLAALTVAAAVRISFDTLDEGRMRIDFNALVNRAENGMLGADEGVDYALFGTDGKVAASTLTGYRVGESVDLHTLSGLDGISAADDTVTFFSPVVRDSTLKGLLLVKTSTFRYRKPDVIWFSLFLLVALLLAGILCTLVSAFHLMRRDLLVPIALLHDATRSILHGDLKTRLHYDSDNEAGILCHDFEAMRDELAAAFRCERELLDKDRLLYACVSHDLKTPLAAISGYAEEFRDGMADTPERVNELSMLMLKKVRLLSKLIDDILEETKAQLGELTISKEEIYASDFFEEICGELSLDAARSGISFAISGIPNVLISIDRKRITQVIQNLVSNSIKYTPHGGLISVRFSVEGSELVVGVKDNGNGIAAGDIPYVFDRFYRGDAARSQNIPGSGLGLSIAKDIVERHGGRIECDSVLGVGTEVSFSLPL
jgi:Signal transduction histidine kinase